MQVTPQPSNVFGEIMLHATCEPAGACQSLDTGVQVAEQRTSQIDWRIVQAATIVVTSPNLVWPASTPDRGYYLMGYRYDHPDGNLCTSELLFCYSLFANSGLVHREDGYQPLQTPEPATP
jgi:hypothetical protein